MCEGNLQNIGKFVKIIVKMKRKGVKSSELEALCWEKGRESLKEGKHKGKYSSLFEFTSACV